MLGTTLGAPEIFVIFIVALLLFGPKKLPEIGRNVGKAITEFRRASNELKSTFDREMQNLETETGGKEAASRHQDDSGSHALSSDDKNGPRYEGAHSSIVEPPSSNPPTLSEPATQGAESPVAAAPDATTAHSPANHGPSEASEPYPEANRREDHRA